MEKNVVLKNREIVEQYKDNLVQYEIRKAVWENENYYSCAVTVSGLGIYSGFSGPCVLSNKSSYENEVYFIKSFIERELNNSDLGRKHIKNMQLFQKEKQLSLF